MHSTEGSRPDKYWWEASESEACAYIFELVKRLQDNQGFIQAENLQHVRLYNDEQYEGLGPGGMSQPLNVNLDRRRVTLNVIKSMCDTVAAKISKNKPKATFLTSGGDFAQQRKAKLLDKFTEGVFYESKIYEEGARVFLDSCVFGTGCLKIFESENEIQAQRIFPDEVIVDIMESRYGKPRTIFQKTMITRDTAKALFPEHSSKLNLTEYLKTDSIGDNIRIEDQIEVIEAWHLPSVRGADDGKHVICAENVTLFSEEWTHDYFPFVFLKWSDQLLGFWGKGLAAELIGIQLEINSLLQRIQQQMYLATPTVLVEQGSEISEGQITNQIFNILNYVGAKPDFYVPKTVSGEVFSHLDRLFERAYEISGISQLAAQSKKPAGLESGVALREFQDIESERFIRVNQRYEEMFMTAAKQMIDLARGASERGDEYEVVSHGDKSIEQINWKDINLEEEEYVMKVFPTSLLPTTPAAKLQSVIDLSQSGLIQNPQTLVKLLEFPDIEAVTSLMTADADIIDLIIEKITEKGEYIPPEPYLNLQLGITRVQQAYLRAKINNLAEGRLDLLRRFITECEVLLASMAMEAQPMMGGDLPMPPPGMGEPGMVGAPMGPEGGLPEALAGGIPMPPGGELPPEGGAPSEDLMQLLSTAGQ